MTRGTLFYYLSPTRVWTSTEFNGDMFHNDTNYSDSMGDKVIKLMKNLNSLEDFKKLLKEINAHYSYNEGYDCWSVSEKAIKKEIEKSIKWIDEERPDLKGNTNYDPRTWDKIPSFEDVSTWQFWGTPNLSDYSYIYNGSKKTLTITTRDGSPMEIPIGAVGVLNYGNKDCLCKDGKIIDGMGNYETAPELKSMDKKEFYHYIDDNFTLDGTSRNLILNILDYIENNAVNAEERYAMVEELLDGIDLKEEEIKMFNP